MFYELFVFSLFVVQVTAADDITISCKLQYIEVSILRNSFTNLKISKLHFKDTSCKPTGNLTHVTLRAPLFGCGTEISRSPNQLQDVFSNSVHGIEPSIAVRCAYPNGAVTETGQDRHRDQINQLPIEVRLYKDRNLSNRIRLEDAFTVVSTAPYMYFSISINKTREQQCMFVESCIIHVQSELTEFKVPMIDNGFAIKRHTTILSRLDNETTFKFNSLYLASIDTINVTIRITCGVRIFSANQTMKLCNCTRIHGNVVCHCNHSNMNSSTYNGTLEKVFTNSSSKDENTNLHGNRHQGPLTRNLSHGNKVNVLNIANGNKASNHAMGSLHLTVSVTNGEIKHVTKDYGSHGNTSHGDKRQFQNIKNLEKRRDNSSFDDSSHRNSSYGNATVSSNVTTAKMVSDSANTSYMLLNSTLRNKTHCICMHIVPVNGNLTESNSTVNNTIRAKSEYNQKNTVHETSSHDQIENRNETGKKMANKITTQNDVENENCSRNNIARNISMNSNKLCNETIDRKDDGNISTNNVTNINVTWYNSSVYSYHNKTTNCTCYETIHESNNEEPPPPQCIPPKWDEEFVVYMAESNWRLIFHDHLVHHVKADGKYDMNLTANESMLDVDAKLKVLDIVKSSQDTKVQPMDLVGCLYLALVITFAPFLLYYLWDSFREKYMRKHDHARA